MRKSVILAVTIISSSMIMGCASSKRMGRLSGTFDSGYSVPESQYIRSEKFQQMEDSSRVFVNSEDKANFGETLVNIWPFFYRSENYYSILWPFIDFDDYGMAVRPFYNNEGDDHSVLFPLSSWNTHTGKGWIATMAWGKNYFGIYPLTNHYKDDDELLFWYTPLLIHSSKKAKPDWRIYYRSLIEKDFTFFMLGYHGTEKYVEMSDHHWLLNDEDEYTQSLRNELTYKFNRENREVPKDLKELNNYRDEVFENLPVVEDNTYGFFPLFHYNKDNNSSAFNLMGLLYHYDKYYDNVDIDVLIGLLANYESSELDENPYDHPYDNERSKLFMPALLSFFETVTSYKQTDKFKTMQNIRGYSHNFRQNKKLIVEELAKITDKKLPKDVVDATTLHYFMREVIAKEKFETETETSNCVFPLFFYSKDSHKKNWFIPMLLTGSKNYENGNSSFISIPILSFAKTSKYEDYNRILWPLIWSSKTTRNIEFRSQIFNNDIFEVQDWRKSQVRNDYAGLGLYYHGETQFLVARDGYNGDDLDTIRVLYHDLKRLSNNIENRNKKLALRIHKNNQTITTNKIEEYRKLIEEEYIKIDQEKIDELQAEYNLKSANLIELCQKVEWQIDEKAPFNDFESKINDFYEKYVTTRNIKDYGNGLFYRKTLLENGDYKWNFLWLLGTGRKNGNYEEFSICHFLYNSKKENQKTEKSFFPFITIREDENHDEFSFMWRLFSIKKENDKTTGYIFFFPY